MTIYIPPYWEAVRTGSNVTWPILPSYTVEQSNPCQYCSGETVKVYHDGLCPNIKAIEYYPDGSIKRIEFREENHG